MTGSDIRSTYFSYQNSYSLINEDRQQKPPSPVAGTQAWRSAGASESLPQDRDPVAGKRALHAIRQPVPPCPFLRTASLSTRRTWPSGFDSSQNRNERSEIKSKKGTQPKSDPRLAPPPLPLSWAFRLRGENPTAKRGKPQFEQGRGRRKHICVRKGGCIIKYSKPVQKEEDRTNYILSSGREGRGGEPVCGLQQALATSAPQVCGKKHEGGIVNDKLFFS